MHILVVIVLVLVFTAVSTIHSMGRSPVFQGWLLHSACPLNLLSWPGSMWQSQRVMWLKVSFQLIAFIATLQVRSTKFRRPLTCAVPVDHSIHTHVWLVWGTAGGGERGVQ